MENGAAALFAYYGGYVVKSTLIKDTTKAERIALIREWIPVEDGLEDDGGIDLWEMYADYINGIREIKEINMSFQHGFYEESDMPAKEMRATPGCGQGTPKR